MPKLRPKSPNGANSPSFYSSPPITTFDHAQIFLLPVPKFQPASGKPRPRAGVIKSLQTFAQKRVCQVALLACHKRATKFLIADLKKPSRPSPSSSPYVQLSRAKTRACLSILRPFDPAELRSPLHKELVAELEWQKRKG